MVDSHRERPINVGDDSDSDISEGHGKSEKKNKATTDSTSGKKRPRKLQSDVWVNFTFCKK